MKKTVFIILFFCLLFFSICSAQDISVEYNTKLIREHFDQPGEKYYRFSDKWKIFDPLDLSYFPHESWNEISWSLLGQKTVSGTYQQMVMLREPASNMVFQGTSIGKEHGFLGDFYLYITMFVADNYPETAGSCYVYFSDSLLKGFHPSHGILIDPASGIYSTDNSYGTTYDPAAQNHSIRLIRPLNGDDYAFDPDDVASSAVHAREYNDEADNFFLADLNSMESAFRMPGSPSVKAYRVEILRKGNIVDVHINGKRAALTVDYMTETDVAGNEIPSMVSWSYGPLLFPGGLTTTCAVGDLYIYGRGN